MEVVVGFLVLVDGLVAFQCFCTKSVAMSKLMQCLRKTWNEIDCNSYEKLLVWFYKKMLMVI